jgi:UDP-N-acetylmuramoylalanine--D-glutamate ligase
VAAALRSFPGPTRLLAGGYDKGIDPEPLVESIRKRCTKAYLFGAAARDLAARLERSGLARAGFEVFADLPSAFRAATSEAEQGDTVLLSPGYASYDQFRDFTERGDLFRALVASLGAP